MDLPTQNRADHLRRPSFTCPRFPTTARGGTIETTLAVVGVLVVASAVTVQLAFGTVTGLLSSFFGEKSELEFITTSPTFGPFTHEVIERGEIESSSNVEVRCQVRARSSSGTNILEIVPEGTWVEKSDFLCRLDDSALQTQLI